MAQIRSIPGARANSFRGRYLSLTSYKRDGTAVPTPVWFVEDRDRLLVQTDANSGKVKRIRANPNVSVAVCSARGRLRDTPLPGLAEVLEGKEHLDRIELLIRQKYRSEMPMAKAAWWVKKMFHLGKQRSATVGLAIKPE